MNETKAVQLFEDNNQLQESRDMASVARATQEIQAALVIGQNFPRNEIKAKTRILEACKRKELAEVAEYEYSRGGTRIVGPTVDLLRAIANRWGNIRYGWTEVERKDGSSMVRCFAWDVQTNGQSERTFTVKHWRDTSGGGYALTDERDIYELMANMAARRVRACLEEVIDADIVTVAIEQCRETLRTGEKTPLADRAVQMLTHFKEFGVTQEMVEAQLGNKLEALSENQFASLRRIYKALKDGVGKREDYFKPQASKPAFDAAAGSATSKAAAPVTPPPATQQAAQSATPPLVENPPGNGPVTQPPAGGVNYVKAVRALCKMSAVHEGQLLEHLAAKGSTDGSVTTLEELAMQYSQVLTTVHDNWKAVVEQMREGK